MAVCCLLKVSIGVASYDTGARLPTIYFFQLTAVYTATPTYLAGELHRHQPLRALHSGTTIPLCTGLTPPLTSTNTHLQSRHLLPGTIYLLPSVILPPWLPSKLRLKHIPSTPLTRHATDSSKGASNSLFRRDIWRQLTKFVLIDYRAAQSLTATLCGCLSKHICIV